jgi:hypothetical protein
LRSRGSRLLKNNDFLFWWARWSGGPCAFKVWDEKTDNNNRKQP